MKARHSHLPSSVCKNLRPLGSDPDFVALVCVGMKLDIDSSHKPRRPGDAITDFLNLGPQDSVVSTAPLILEGRAKTKAVQKSTLR